MRTATRTPLRPAADHPASVSPIHEHPRRGTLGSSPQTHRRATTIALFAAFGVWLTAPWAHGQETVERRAESLFLQGRDALATKDYPRACERFRQSILLLRRASVLVNLAQCEEAQGRLATALRLWNEGIALLDRSDERLPVARQRVQALESRVPRLHLRPSPAFPSSAAIKLDGKLLLATDLGAPIPIDPGPCKVVVSIPGLAERVYDLVAHEAERLEVLLDAEHAPPAASAARRPLPPEPPPAPNKPASRTTAWVAAGFGAAGILTGVVTGIMVLSSKSTVDANCPNKLCNAQGLDAVDSANALLKVNSIGWGVGLVGSGLATWLFLSSPSSVPSPKIAITPTWSPGGLGLVLDRRF